MCFSLFHMKISVRRRIRFLFPLHSEGERAAHSLLCFHVQMAKCSSLFNRAAKRGVKVAVCGASFFVKGGDKTQAEHEGADSHHTKRSILLSNKAWILGPSTTTLYPPRPSGLTMNVGTECTPKFSSVSFCCVSWLAQMISAFPRSLMNWTN